MKLTATTIKSAKPKEKPYKLFDGHGLYLEVRPNSSKRWRFKYLFEGKEKLISLGSYPLTTLKEARDKHFNKRKMLENGINPSEVRKEKKAEKDNAHSFETVAKEWWNLTKSKWTTNHGYQIYRRLEMNVFPWVGDRNIKEITTPELLKVLRRIEARGAFEMAHRVKYNCSQVFSYAQRTGIVTQNICEPLKKDALSPVKKKHHASITDPKKVGGLLRALDSYEGHFITRCALKLAPLTFVRPGELRQAEWSEIDFEKKEWRIPAEKMKMRTIHIVPLSKQSIEVLEEIQPLTGRGKYVFPSTRSAVRPMSNNAVTGALRRMGYTSEEMTGHGFRSMASTLLNEQGYNWDAVERQLAHSERNSVRAAYNYADYIPERTKMMQEWADYLDGLKTVNKKL